MKSVRTRPLSAVMLSVVMTVSVVGGVVGPASAAYNPSAPPYPADPDNATSLTIYDAATGAVVDHGSSTTALSSYLFVSKTDFSPNQTKAYVSGFLAEAGKAPGDWSGSLLGPATTYPVGGFTTPTAKGGSTDTFDELATKYPNKAASTSDFSQLYQVRVKTSFPSPQSQSYAFGDIQIDPAAHTWKQVNPAPAAAAKTAPGTPANVSATPGDGSATVTFTAPSDGNDPITGYTVTATPQTGTAITTQSTGSPTTVSGLTNGTTYDITVTATNNTGTGSPSAAVQVTPAVPAPVAVAPAAPTSVRAVARDGGATVTFTAPASDGGSAITSYTVRASTGETRSTTTGSPVVFTGLTNGTGRSFTVTATNDVGTSAASVASNTVAFYTTSLTSALTPTTINAGGHLYLRGTLKGGAVASKHVVATVVAAYGHGTRYLTLTTSSTGTYSTSFVATYNTTVIVRYAATSTQRSATALTRRAAVRTNVRITSPKTGTRTRTRTVAFTGTTSPNKAGQYVALYERRGTTYAKLVSGKVASNGTFRLVRTFTKKATYVLQVRIATVTGNTSGNSNSVTLYEI